MVQQVYKFNFKKFTKMGKDYSKIEFKAGNAGGSYENQTVSSGSYKARIIIMVDKGTHPKFFKGKETGTERKLRLSFELLGEMRVFKEGESPKPVVIHWDISNNNGEKSRIMKLAASLNKGFDLRSRTERESFNVFTLINKECIIELEEVQKEDKSYNNVKGVTAPTKGDVYPEAENVCFAFKIPDTAKEINDWMEELARLHPKTRETIYESPEWKRLFSKEDTKRINDKADAIYEKIKPANNDEEFSEEFEEDSDSWK